MFKLKPAYAQALAEAGVAVRYYNTSAIFRLVSIQHRSQKLLIVDEKTVLTGGRNIANDYFDLLTTTTSSIRPRSVWANGQNGAPEFRCYCHSTSPRTRARF